MGNVIYSLSGQAMPEKSLHIPCSAFSEPQGTAIYWLGGGGVLIVSRGTSLMLDPVLEGFDMPLLVESPLLPSEVPSLDGVLITHVDNDHFSRLTCMDLAPVCKSYHAPAYLGKVLQEMGLPGYGHSIGESFPLNNLTVTLTPALHNWQNGAPEYSYRHWSPEDGCGYRIQTPDGSIWLPGDSKLLPEQLTQPVPDVILFDFSDNDWHITFEGAVTLANAYPEAELICIHWGTVDAPEMSPFNGDPGKLLDRIQNPGRIRVLNPGEKFVLKKKR